VHEYGKSWSPSLPRRDIALVVHRMHCGTSDEDVQAEIRRRCEKAAIPARLVPSCLDYAVLVHRAQQAVWLMFR